jgi:hypothetical protein
MAQGLTKVFLFAGLLAGIGLGLTGCAKSDSEQAVQSSVNGFICAQCNAKIYTGAKEFPTVCPVCKKGELREVVAFVCAKDKSLILVPRGPQSVPCPKCQTMTDSIKLPREPELIAWGAKKHTP